MFQNGRNYDVVIAGAGPAGTACALTLVNSGLRVALVDRAAFPRDKTCGDAIPHRAIRILKQLSPSLYRQIGHDSRCIRSTACCIVGPSGNQVVLPFQREGYLARRIDFDYLLLQHVLSLQTVDFLPAEKIMEVKTHSTGVDIVTDKQTLHARLIIGCDGAQSVVRKQLLTNRIHPDHYCAAVRAYYSGIEGIRPGRMEIYLFSDLPFAYFWIFPLSDGVANAGLGMLTQQISRQKVNLRRCFASLLSAHEPLVSRFHQAVQISEPAGWGLPLGSVKSKMSGYRFLLCGDAASLVDPVTGEGIGNAMLSGMLAAQQALKCFLKNDFSEKCLAEYDHRMHSLLGKEFYRKYQLQRLLGRYTFLAEQTIRMARQWPWLAKHLQKLF